MTEVGSDRSVVVSMASVSLAGTDGTMALMTDWMGEMMGSRRRVEEVVSGRSLTGSVVFDDSAVVASTSVDDVVAGALDVTTPVGAITMGELGELEVVSCSTGAVEVVEPSVELDVVVSVSGSSLSVLSVGSTMIGGMPPVDELSSDEVTASSVEGSGVDSVVVSSVDS